MYQDHEHERDAKATGLKTWRAMVILPEAIIWGPVPGCLKMSLARLCWGRRRQPPTSMRAYRLASDDGMLGSVLDARWSGHCATRGHLWPERVCLEGHAMLT